MASPGWRAISRGRGETEDELNPGDGERVAEEDIRILCSNCGFVVDVYCPGSKCKEGAPWDASVAPTNCQKNQNNHNHHSSENARVTLAKPSRH